MWPWTRWFTFLILNFLITIGDIINNISITIYGASWHTGNIKGKTWNTYKIRCGWGELLIQEQYLLYNQPIYLKVAVNPLTLNEMSMGRMLGVKTSKQHPKGTCMPASRPVGGPYAHPEKGCFWMTLTWGRRTEVIIDWRFMILFVNFRGSELDNFHGDCLVPGWPMWGSNDILLCNEAYYNHALQGIYKSVDYSL